MELEVSARPLEVRVLTLDDEILPRPGRDDTPSGTTPIEIRTESDPSGLEPSVPPYQLRSEYPHLQLNTIKAILIQSTETRWISSSVDNGEGYRLGGPGSAAPPPPDWHREFGNTPAWKPVHRARTGANTGYINRAEAVWASAEGSVDSRPGEYLLRYGFQVESPAPTASALLSISVQGKVLEIRLNDAPLLTGQPGNTLHDTFDVTHLLRRDLNVLAFHVQAPGEIAVLHPSVAWSLERTVSPAHAAPDRSRYRQTLLHARNGNRVWGKLLTFNPMSAFMETPYGRYSAPWAEIESLTFPRGWVEASPPRRGFRDRMRKFFGLPPQVEIQADSDLKLFAAPLSRGDFSRSSRLILNQGRLHEGEFSIVGPETLAVRSTKAGEPLRLSRKSVVAIYPAAQDSPERRRIAPAYWPLRCRIRTTLGEDLSGILRELSSDQIVLEIPHQGILNLPPMRVAWIWFPGHRIAPGRSSGLQTGNGLSAAPADRKILMIASSAGLLRNEDYARRIEAEFRQAAINEDIEVVGLKPSELIDRQAVSPRRFPVTFVSSIDGSYPASFDAPGDIGRNLEAYVLAGGTLVVHARRGALHRPYSFPGGGQTESTVPEGVLAERLGIQTVLPGDEIPDAVQPFIHPPNRNDTLRFKRVARMPAPLTSLPPLVPVPDVTDAVLHPVISRDSNGEIVLYEMMGDSGTRFGPVMTIFPRGEGMIILINHMLWSARIEGGSFTEVILPHILSWALTGRGVPNGGMLSTRAGSYSERSS